MTCAVEFKSVAKRSDAGARALSDGLENIAGPQLLSERVIVPVRPGKRAQNWRADAELFVLGADPKPFHARDVPLVAERTQVDDDLLGGQGHRKRGRASRP